MCECVAMSVVIEGYCVNQEVSVLFVGGRSGWERGRLNAVCVRHVHACAFTRSLEKATASGSA